MEKQKMVEISDNHGDFSPWLLQHFLDSIKFSSNGNNFQKLGKISNIAKIPSL